MISKAVFPVAGLGTRFLPATKASPKEMLTVVDKPLIQYAVEEAVAAGIKELIFVTSSAKRAIEDHFDKSYELEDKLAASGKRELLELVQNIVPKDVSCVYIRQQEALGLGHAVLCAERVVGGEPFAVLLADDLIRSEVGCLSQMVKVHEQQAADGVLAVQTVPDQDVGKYGIVRVSKGQRIEEVLEKPTLALAPSRLGVVGRYILPSEVFAALTRVKPGIGGEIQLTDGIASLLATHHIYAHTFTGRRYDCGSKLGFFEANLDYALAHTEMGTRCLQLLKERVEKLQEVT